MKFNKATYLSFFFLLCFVCSFGVCSIQNFNTSKSKLPSIEKSLSVSKKENNASNGTDFLLEENEKETESNFEAQAFILPFLFSFFQTELYLQKYITAKSPAVVVQNPIYVSVHNFRI